MLILISLIVVIVILIILVIVIVRIRVIILYILLRGIQGCIIVITAVVRIDMAIFVIDRIIILW